jgi:formate/nitrite transporter FocA (FNT family)
MNKVKSTLLAGAFLGTIIALVTVSTTLMSSQEQRKRAAEAMAFSLPLQVCAVANIDCNGR